MPSPARLLLALALLSGCGSKSNEEQANADAAAPTAADTPAHPQSFSVCLTCHTVQRGRNGIGPSLFGVVGRKAGSLPGYAYSTAMKAHAATWDEPALDRFLTAPIATVPGTKMTFAGMKDQKERAEVIAYLATLK
jgi:cytochrome c